MRSTLVLFVTSMLGAAVALPRNIVPPPCTAVDTTTCPTLTTPTNGSDFTYTQYYNGTNTESPTNPGARSPPTSSVLPGCLPSCDAAQKCADLAHNSGQGYLSFDVHRSSVTHRWTCVLYFGPNSDASYFSVEEQGVDMALGYASYTD